MHWTTSKEPEQNASLNNTDIKNKRGHRDDLLTSLPTTKPAHPMNHWTMITHHRARMKVWTPLDDIHQNGIQNRKIEQH